MINQVASAGSNAKQCQAREDPDPKILKMAGTYSDSSDNEEMMMGGPEGGGWPGPGQIIRQPFFERIKSAKAPLAVSVPAGSSGRWRLNITQARVILLCHGFVGRG